MLKLTQESALNLTLEGSVGSFNVGTGRQGQNSVEVKYFLTHIGLDFSAGANEALLSQLAPVREIFGFEQLDFDEIMQRDIDDARVSGELIPYLLDEKSADLIKLFPPIIVVVLPAKEHENKPASLYPKVEEIPVPAHEDTPEKLILRSGAVGQEIFQFEQPILNDVPLKHDLVRLKLNSHKTRLVIVDGQHRAMALLALYRNLKDEWSHERRSPFKEYYAEWTPNFIQQFNLKEINLPVMLCTFPDLCDGYTGDLDLKKAARSIFLTLNKTARKVSNSRNILLNDNDIISLFLRRCLSVIKGRDTRSPHSLRISNIELDQFEDRLRIQNPISISGVNHIYYIIEHLLLNKREDVNGAKPRTGKFYKRTDLTVFGAMDRLNGRNLLGADLAQSTTRDMFTAKASDVLGQNFDENFGKYIIDTFETFIPYEIHNQSVLELDARLEVMEDRKLRPILFEGQGIGRVFETHRENLKQRLKDGVFETDVPKIQALVKRLDDTHERIEKAINQFSEQRALKYIDKIADKSKVKTPDGNLPLQLIKFVDDLYDHVVTTVAFEAALICGFTSEIERANLNRQKTGKKLLNREQLFSEYIQQLSSFFIPTTSSQLKRLIRLFCGELEGEIFEWKIAKSPQTFRAVVYKGEMQPDQWPKYKYLFLEIWKPTEVDLSASISSERKKCRNQILTTLYDEYRSDFARQNMKHEDTLTAEENKNIFKDAYNAFVGFLKLTGLTATDMPTQNQMFSAIERGAGDAGPVLEDREFWDSGDIS